MGRYERAGLCYKERYSMSDAFYTLKYSDGELSLIDQRILPTQVAYFICRTSGDVEFAIRDMVVRGAPAIGATAAYGVYFAAAEAAPLYDPDNTAAFEETFFKTNRFLFNARPTAVNLGWAIERMEKHYRSVRGKSVDTVLSSLLSLADFITEEDVQINKRLSARGAEVVPEGATILTHCNTGALATAGWGTALGVIKTAFHQDKNIFVYADETRPRLQGARLTAWELKMEGIPSKLISDSVAATLIRDGKIDLVILGADRVAANGDVCNKIGTFMLSALCKMYHVPFYSAFPVSTIDFSIASGAEIPIEERDGNEVTHIQGVQVAPEGMEVYNPAFDVTPHEHVTGLITEKGVLYPPFDKAIAALKEQIG